AREPGDGPGQRARNPHAARPAARRARELGRRGRALRRGRAGLPAAAGRERRAHGRGRAARLRGAQRVPQVLRARGRVPGLREPRRRRRRSDPRAPAGGGEPSAGGRVRLPDAHRAQADRRSDARPRAGGTRACAAAPASGDGAATFVLDIGASMKLLAELDHYEVLEVARDARREEIERAFALVRSAYDGESLAAYSVVPPDEAKLWRERIDEAWRVLSDPEARSAYDAALADGGGPDDGERDPFAGMDDDREAAPGASAFADASAAAPPERAELPAAPDAPPTSLAAARATQPLPVEERPAERLLSRDLEAFEDDPDDDGAEWTGARLRRARLLRGLEID